jgi:ankyrin repeat protein
VNETDPLFWACSFKRAAVVRVLLAAGADRDRVHESDGKVSTPLRIAVALGSLPTVKALVEGGADVNVHEISFSPLHTAVRANPTSIARVLVEAGADVDDVDPGGLTPFLAAAWTGNVKMMQFLKDGGSWLDTRDNLGHNALHPAALSENPAAVRYVLGLKVIEVNSRSAAGETPLHFAARTRSVVSAKALVSAGADANAATTNLRMSVLQCAVVYGPDDPEMLKLLIEAGADVKVTFKGWNLLLIAADRLKWKVVDFLLRPPHDSLWSDADKIDVLKRTRAEGAPYENLRPANQVVRGPADL